MNSTIILAIGAGATAGAILLFLSHVAPFFRAANFLRDVDQPILFGSSITRREAHIVGILVHLVISGVFAGLYALLVSAGIFPGFHLVPLLIWSAVMTIFVGGIVLPLEGHGIFGLKEDAWFPVDLMVTNVLWSILFWWLMRLWLGLGFFS